MHSGRRLARGVGLALLAGTLLAALAGVAAAHGGSLRTTQQELTAPTWLFLMTGGGAVGASFLLASFVTDRGYIRAIEEARGVLAVPRTDLLVRAVRVVGVLGLLAVVVVGFLGPTDPLSNLAVLVVWGLWWAGFTVSTYLVGNAWPALNPWRTVSSVLPSLDRPYPDRLGAWPAVVGLLGLIWLEVVSPLADAPRLLAVVVVAYTVATLAGAAVFGDAWFARVDPVSLVFRFYGRVAPLTREDGRLRVRSYGSALSEPFLGDDSEVAFVVALLWVTTYDGLVATPAWETVLRPVMAGLGGALGLGPDGVAVVATFVVYPLVLVGGFVGFRWLLRLAARRGHHRAASTLPIGLLERRFAPSLLAIAAGYHAAHYLGYFLQLLPAAVGALANPLAPGEPTYLVLPALFGLVGPAFVLAGHWLAVWVAHTTSYDLFPSRVQAIRSQYALTAVMMGYTILSLGIVFQPFTTPPFLL